MESKQDHLQIVVTVLIKQKIHTMKINSNEFITGSDRLLLQIGQTRSIDSNQNRSIQTNYNQIQITNSINSFCKFKIKLSIIYDTNPTSELNNWSLT